jgi:hypothetical protein
MGTFEQRRRAIRHHRASSRVSSATHAAAWISGFGALLIVVVGGLSNLR